MCVLGNKGMVPTQPQGEGYLYLSLYASCLCGAKGTLRQAEKRMLCERSEHTLIKKMHTQIETRPRWYWVESDQVKS